MNPNRRQHSRGLPRLQPGGPAGRSHQKESIGPFRRGRTGPRPLT